MSANLANDSNTQQTDKGNLQDCRIHSTTHSGGSCFSMASDMYGTPSRGGRIQSRMAPGMYHPCLSGRDTSKPRARRLPLTGGRLPRGPTYAPILEPERDEISGSVERLRMIALHCMCACLPCVFTLLASDAAPDRGSPLP